jgi:5S rRNA maturation endonuclease (ribonuclease M5)
MNTIEDIKKIVVVEGVNDREKVNQLKRLLGLQ